MLLSCLSSLQARANDAPLIASALRLSADQKHFKLELDVDQAPAFTFHYIGQPPRVILDLPRTSFTLPKAVKTSGMVKSVRFGTMAEGQARLVVTLDKPARLNRTEVIPANGGSTLILEGDTVSRDEFETLLADQDWSVPKAESAETKSDIPASAAVPQPGAAFLVAVDAGHGGIDTGATSADGKTIEKDITLSFARKLAEKLNATPGIQAFLTREDDRFLSLSERVELARGRKANLFVSLHADKLKQDDIRGATVYTISDKASDSLSASVAERENFSDEIAGIKFVEEPAEVADILLDLTRRETQAFSVTLAQSVIKSFDGQIELINNPHRSAGFRVLRAPEIPSILVEMGFLSNKKDESLLIDDAYRDKVAQLLTEAIARYHSPDAAVPQASGN